MVHKYDRRSKTDPNGVPYFNDLCLDLIVYPDGTIVVDDMDELEEHYPKRYYTGTV